MTLTYLSLHTYEALLFANASICFCEAVAVMGKLLDLLLFGLKRMLTYEDSKNFVDTLWSAFLIKMIFWGLHRVFC